MTVATLVVGLAVATAVRWADERGYWLVDSLVVSTVETSVAEMAALKGRWLADEWGVTTVVEKAAVWVGQKADQLGIGHSHLK